MTRQELKEKINGIDIDDAIKIELLENVEDLEDIDVIPDEEKAKMEAELEDAKSKYEEIKGKYKARFLDKPLKEETDIEEEKDDEVIDIKEI